MVATNVYPSATFFTLLTFYELDASIKCAGILAHALVSNFFLEMMVVWGGPCDLVGLIGQERFNYCFSLI